MGGAMGNPFWEVSRGELNACPTGLHVHSFARFLSASLEPSLWTHWIEKYFDQILRKYFFNFFKTLFRNNLNFVFLKHLIKVFFDPVSSQGRLQGSG